MQVYTVDIPASSLIHKSLSPIEYEDAFALKAELKEPISIAELPIVFFDVMPKWFGVLMGIREMIAGWIGLKTAKGIDVQKQRDTFTGKVGESIALFHVHESNESEIVMGENDKHLDFRLSFFKQEIGKETEIILATTVKFKGWLGHLYFFPVKPFHRLIVPIILKRMVKKLK